MDALELLLARIGLVLAGLFLTALIVASGVVPLVIVAALVGVIVIIVRNRHLPALYAA